MISISGFTFIHNGVAGGYPFVEAIEAIANYANEIVVVDMESTDQTRQVLEQLHHKHDLSIIDGKWAPGTAGACLAAAHSMYGKCVGDVVWHFEADEVYESSLATAILAEIRRRSVLGLGNYSIDVLRLQVSQNFQRCRWYPEYVHRVWANVPGVVKQGQTTNIDMPLRHSISPRHGYLWDCTNCFRDDFMQRIEQQAELWGAGPNYLMVPLHATHAVVLDHDKVIEELKDERWTWKRSPFDLPSSLSALVGITSYEEMLRWRRLI